MLTVSGISPKIVKFSNRVPITTVHNHKRRYFFTMFVNSTQRSAKFVRQRTENSANHNDVRDRRGIIVYCARSLKVNIGSGLDQEIMGS